MRTNIELSTTHIKITGQRFTSAEYEIFNQTYLLDTFKPVETLVENWGDKYITRIKLKYGDSWIKY